jgi:hypothetical protein
MPPTLDVTLHIFEDIFTTEELEGYICTYEPEGIDLGLLHTICDLDTIGRARYHGVLVEVATLLLYSGHQLAPLHILQQMGLVFLPHPLPLIQVMVIPSLFSWSFVLMLPHPPFFFTLGSIFLLLCASLIF